MVGAVDGAIPVLVGSEGFPPAIKHLNEGLNNPAQLDLVRHLHTQRVYPGNDHCGDDLIGGGQAEVTAANGNLTIKEGGERDLVQFLSVLHSGHCLLTGYTQTLHLEISCGEYRPSSSTTTSEDLLIVLL